MDNAGRKYIVLFFAILIMVMAGAYIANIVSAPEPAPLKPAREAKPTAYITVRDNKGNVILETGVPVYENDEYISAANVNYIIISVSGNQAVARVKKTCSPLKSGASLYPLTPSVAAAPAQGLPQGNARHMVIYHTHSDESYVPTSGAPSEPGNGDIYAVGSSFANALEMGGISTYHSFNRHDPHDINAYHRSRRTALQLLKQRPDAAFDLHRDSAPPESYLTLVNGVSTGRVMIVVGRSNPNMRANLKYAKRIKAKADELYPGLMRGIFLGRGDYNQDLYPTALLFEVGTEGITLDEANKAVRCLADSVIRVPLQ